MLNHDTRLYPHHLDPGRWGLKNVGAANWVMIRPDGDLRDVEPGRIAALAAGVRLGLGKIEGEITI